MDCRMKDGPFDKLGRFAASEGCGQATARWLALLALLGNLMVPAAVSIVFSPAEPSRDLLRVGLCGGSSGDAPGKAKPSLLVQHCLLCTVTAAPLPRPPRFALPTDIAEQRQFQLGEAVSVTRVRHRGIQARAPPSMA
jgi:hypothetical protein